MSSGSSSIKFKYPPGVQQNLQTATGLLGQEQQRMESLTSALQGFTPTAYNLLGFDPQSQDPYVRQMLNTLIGGGQIDPGQFMQRTGTAPGAVADPGPRPISYRQEFQQRGFKSWGKNDDAAEARRNAEIKAWDAKNAAFQQYQQQQAAYNASPTEQIPNFETYRAQAQQEYDRYQQVQRQNQQLQQFQQQAFARAQDTTGIQSLLGRLQSQLSGEPLGWQDALSNLNTYEQQLQQSFTPSEDWTQQFQTAGRQVNEYQSYLQRVLSGEEQMDPAIARLASERDVETRNSLYKQLGPGFETSTAGADWLTKLQQATRESEFGERQRMLSSGLAGVQGAVGIQGTLRSQQQDLINQALGRYTQGISNIGTLGDIYQRDIASTMNTLGGLYQNQYNALNVAGLPNQAYQFQDWSGLIPTLQSLTATPYSQSLMPLVQGYQGIAGSWGQNAVAQQPSQSLLSQITPILGQVAGAGLGAFVGPLAGLGASAAGQSLFPQTWGSTYGYRY